MKQKTISTSLKFLLAIFSIYLPNLYASSVNLKRGDIITLGDTVVSCDANLEPAKTQQCDIWSPTGTVCYHWRVVYSLSNARCVSECQVLSPSRTNCAIETSCTFDSSNGCFTNTFCERVSPSGTSCLSWGTRAICTR